MPKEIERKFRLGRAPAWLPVREGDEIEQGYLAIGEESEVRLRRRGDDRTLTVKRGQGESREEFEVSLGAKLFNALWPATAGRRLTKRRHLVGLDDGLCAEVDVYAGELADLVVAEVEFDSERQGRAFQPPPWLGEEVTGDHRYANQSLALAARVPDDAVKMRSRGYRLKGKEAPAAGVRRIAAGRLSKAVEKLRNAERGEEVAESIHDARKDLKKLRAVLRLVRDELGEDVYGVENERYREAARALSGTRDAQVKGETLGFLLENARVDAATLQLAGTWRRVLEREEEEASERARDGGGEPIASALERLQGSEEAIDDWTLGKGSWSLMAPGLARAYKRGRRAMRQASGGDPEAVHQWRKRAKDLWYHQRILRVVWPEAMEAAAELTHDLADLLGDHHDLTVLGEDLRSRDFPRIESNALENAIGARQRKLLGEALDLGARIYVEKPKAFRKRIHGYWKLWGPPRG